MPIYLVLPFGRQMTFQTTIYSILRDNMILFSQIFTVAAVGYRSIVTICPIFFLTK